MKKAFKKFATMGLAAIMAASAMSISAFADESTSSDDVVLSVLNDKGVMQDYTQADIDALDGPITAYKGITVTFMSDEEIAQQLSETYFLKKISLTGDDTPGYSSYKPLDEYSMSGERFYNGDFSIRKDKNAYSNHILTDHGSTVSLIIEPEKDDNGVTVSFNDAFRAKVMDNETNKIIISFSVDTTTGFRMENVSSESKLYVHLYNGNSFTANGQAHLSTY